jgi:integrase
MSLQQILKGILPRQNQIKAEVDGTFEIRDGELIVRGGTGTPDVGGASEPDRRNEELKGFYVALEAAGRSRLTLTGYASDMRFWERQGAVWDKQIRDLKVGEIEPGIVGLDVATRKRKVAAIRAYARHLLRSGSADLLLELEKLNRPRPKGRIARVTNDLEYKETREKARELCGKADRRGIWLGLMTWCGLRISEIATAQAGDGWIQVIGKGNKERRVPCPDWLCDAVKNAKKKEKGGYQRARRIIDRSLRKDGYSHFHKYRHTYATTLLHRGVTLDQIRVLLGHASINTTQIYAKTKIPENICKILDG